MLAESALPWIGAAGLAVGCGGAIATAFALVDDKDSTARPVSRPAPAGFHVQANRIVDPAGRTFVVKGVTSPYGTFIRGRAGRLARARRRVAGARRRRDAARTRSRRKVPTAARRSLGAASRKMTAAPGTLAAPRRELAAARRQLAVARREFSLERRAASRNLSSARRDFARLRRLGANTVRIVASPRSRRVRRLGDVIRSARRAGLVAQIAVTDATPGQATRFLRRLAHRYRRDSGVWLTPMVEPNCHPRRASSACEDWPLWWEQHRRWLRAIRSEGMTAPVVVNTPSWSSSLTGLDAYRLGDRGLVYGVHTYADDAPAFDAAARRAAEANWAGLAVGRPVIVDQVGAWNGPGRLNSGRWLTGFIRYLRHWVNRRGGAGASAYMWRWVEPNRMVGRHDTLTTWGRLFVRGYLGRVPGRRPIGS